MKTNASEDIDPDKRVKVSAEEIEPEWIQFGGKPSTTAEVGESTPTENDHDLEVPQAYREWDQKLLKKAGENFEKVHDVLAEAWAKQCARDDLSKAPDMWERGSNVPNYLRSYVEEAAIQVDTMWGEFNDVPHTAALRVHEIIKEGVTSDGWNINEIANQIDEEFEGIDDSQARTIARTEVASIMNKARERAFEASEYEYEFYWSGPSDASTTDLCEEVKTEVENNGGQMPLPELKDLLREKARKYDDYGLPARVDEGIAHYQERHTWVREEFQFADI